MAEIKWIKLKTDIFSDEKILLIEQMPEADTILVIWLKLLCLAGKENNCGVFLMRNRMPYTEEMLATIFRRPLNTVRLALNTFETFGMIEIEDDIICIPNWEKHQNIDGMEKIKEQNRLRKQKQRERQRFALEDNCHVTSRDCHATDKEKEEDIDIDNNIYSASAPKKADIEIFFERIWKLYPNKKGKGQVSDAKKKALYAIGYDELSRAIDRYQKELQKDKDWRKPQNGSTFFNSGYVDYLDANYSGDQTQASGQTMDDLDEFF